MQKVINTLGLLAAATMLAGCEADAQRKADEPFIIAQGRPPIGFSVSQPGRLIVTDENTHERIFSADITEGDGNTLVRFDKARGAIMAAEPEHPEQLSEILKIDPNHRFTVILRPSGAANPFFRGGQAKTATMPPPPPVVPAPVPTPAAAPVAPSRAPALTLTPAIPAAAPTPPTAQPTIVITTTTKPTK